MGTKKNVKGGRAFLYLPRHLMTIIALVMIWRGVWHVLDAIEQKILGSTTGFFAALVSIAIGIFLLYLPDKDLKEIEKL